MPAKLYLQVPISNPPTPFGISKLGCFFVGNNASSMLQVLVADFKKFYLSSGDQHGFTQIHPSKWWTGMFF